MSFNNLNLIIVKNANYRLLSRHIEVKIVVRIKYRIYRFMLQCKPCLGILLPYSITGCKAKFSLC